MKALLALALLACGGEPAKSLIDGEWDYEFRGDLACNNGGAPSGTLVVYEGTKGALSGQYDVCAKATASNDLAGRINGQRFELEMFGGSVGVVGGMANGVWLDGEVTGLGEGITFHAVRKDARQGKPAGPP